ncbi:NAD(P)-dependent alcohol dehydrogenase [Mycoplasmatota bacterium zrk1]
MKQAIGKRYGNHSRLNIIDSPIPKPVGDEVLVKIHASSINSADVEILKGIFFIRMGSPFKPMYRVLGSDISGIVEAVGPLSTKFKIGSKVYADLTEWKFGCFSEYKVVSEKSLRPIPENMSYVDAASIPSAAIIAYQGLVKFELSSEHKVLINGAGGGMGTYAIQIAKSFGAEITAVDNKHKQSIMRNLGADYVYDYKEVDFSQDGKQYDLILDCKGQRAIKKIKNSLSDYGHYVLIGGTTRSIIATLIASRKNKKSKQNISILYAKYNDQNYLEQVQRLYKEKKLTPIIDSIYDLTEIKEAWKRFESGEFIGKIVIKP